VNVVDYNRRADVVKGVSLFPFLPRGYDREALIKQFHITPNEVEAARREYNAALRTFFTCLYGR